MDDNSRNFGMTLSGRNYIMCRSMDVAATVQLQPLKVESLLAVSVRQVQSKDIPLSDD